MARPFKARRVCSQPMVEVFGPLDQDAATRVELTLEEYETIRLIDLLDCTQEECAGQMGVARTTVQAVYNSARKKLAQVLVDGKRLCISGGAYELCPHSAGCCKKECRRSGCENCCEKKNRQCGDCTSDY